MLVTSDIPVRLGEKEYEDKENFLKMRRIMFLKDCWHDDDDYHKEEVLSMTIVINRYCVNFLTQKKLLCRNFDRKIC